MKHIRSINQQDLTRSEYDFLFAALKRRAIHSGHGLQVVSGLSVFYLSRDSDGCWLTEIRRSDDKMN